ncbi:hypothetical protein GE21DRAFT_9262 [Neurospora crassa]|uniref:Adenosine deaminase domain-containing protein n=1 Tax=Neurospora crassa (strain ATCC 24698 / 74-OR23-1A / CBS 708.71 / DSM 1257 / FGSC 987) TaxID=367110 RepID=Q7RZG8_NEUCR|nr:hypothetical protein NCU04048 [Neurospora crassa OR74A]EAA28427.2 hypothetical protein NCU04048 [Neurospora crassa OR74A]KHE81847.1 hypothetical protein GE21DRAFT_9262 [Neurospora crassa]|eukprot:XP_957663.2 hypothetical protein NCU04048 [Neurospora crassa OR74A]
MCGMAQKKDPSSPHPLSKLRRIFSSVHSSKSPSPPTSDQMASGDEKPRAPVPRPYDLVESFDRVIAARDKHKSAPIKLLQQDNDTPTPPNAKEYFQQRDEVIRREKALGFDHHCTSEADSTEMKANAVIQRLKDLDVAEVYEKEARIEGYAGQKHKRVPGDRFLVNAPVIEKTRLYRAIQNMPKGAHLHIHFNANLLPEVLLNIAKKQDYMYIMSDIPLLDKKAFERCHLKFSILSDSAFKTTWLGQPDLFTRDKSDVNGAKEEDESGQPKHIMLFKEFCNGFAKKYEEAYASDEKSRLKIALGKDLVDEYLTRKIVFQPDEAYNPHQTAKGAWQRFNAHTQMMKGLFNYEAAYREYTQKCLEEFVNDNIQYAEIRPNFMETNQVWHDNGEGRIDNEGIMDLIIGVYEKFQETHKHRIFKGLKIIYCTPRSFNPSQVKFALDQCLTMKQNDKYAKYIAGFDLVGEEGAGHPLSHFIEEFLVFKDKCRDAKVDIPFLFHCGETLDVGTETDGNLVDALLLGSKRIGHGFALAWHPYITQRMKKQNVCIEVCPISNEILGLTPRISGHTVYSLLANDVHCTISTDNGTLFRSRLSHDFYQIMVGKADMSLYGLRQLIEWSIDHSCMDDEERDQTRRTWEKLWKQFCDQLVREYPDLVPKSLHQKL